MLTIPLNEAHSYRVVTHLWIGFSRNSAERAVNNINKRSEFQIFFRPIAHKQPTSHTIHPELLLQFPFAAD